MALNYTPYINYTPAPTQSINYTPANYTPNPATTTAAPSSGVSNQQLYSQYTSPEILGSSSSSNDDDGGGFDASDYAKSLGYSTTGAAKAAYGVSSLEELFNKLKGEEAKKAEEAKKQAAEIGQTFDPIIAELDAQVGLLPGQQAALSSQVGTLASGQMANVDVEKDQAITDIEGEKVKSLRNLEEDIRNAMQAAGTFIGNLGGGSSSATGRAGEAITRQGLKGRTNVLENVQRVIGQINSTALKEKNSIETWKNSKLVEIVTTFQDRANNLKLMLAQTKGEKQRVVYSELQRVASEYKARLAQLDDTYTNYVFTVDQWERERAAELEDYATKLNMGTAAGGQDISKAVSLAQQLMSIGYSPQQTQEILQNQGYNLPVGFTGAEEDDELDPFGFGNSSEEELPLNY